MPSAKRFKASAHAWPHWRPFSEPPQMMWRSRRAGKNCCGTPSFPLLARPEPFIIIAYSRISEKNCNLYPRSQVSDDSPTTFKTTQMFQGSSKIYKSPSPTIRFVHDLCIVLDADKVAEGATNGNLRARV